MGLVEDQGQGLTHEAKAKAKDLGSEAMAKAKDLSLEAKAKAKNLTLDAKAKASSMRPRGASRPRPGLEDSKTGILLINYHKFNILL